MAVQLAKLGVVGQRLIFRINVLVVVVVIVEAAVHLLLLLLLWVQLVGQQHAEARFQILRTDMMVVIQLLLLLLLLLECSLERLDGGDGLGLVLVGQASLDGAQLRLLGAGGRVYLVGQLLVHHPFPDTKQPQVYSFISLITGKVPVT